MKRFFLAGALLAAAALGLAFMMAASGQSRKPRPPINRPPVTETEAKSNASSNPRVSFRCAKDKSVMDLILDVRNNGPDGLSAGATIYYYYRTPTSDMSIVGSQQLEQKLDKGGIFSIKLGSDAQTRITECGCSLKRFIPTARTSTQKSN
ncbi:MAG TPA: hypothetical protein VE961_22140 [Pyrinomonadaceae bacterium]|nr:hypothetical protein [Pyrinomonadaceae bacterium]